MSIPPDDEMLWNPIDHLCKWCNHRLEALDCDIRAVRCRNPTCQAETSDGGHRELCWCGADVGDAPVRFACIKNPRPTAACPDEIIVVERPVTAAATAPAAKRAARRR